ncbi:E3 ubiquitin-protein ligase DCST1 isoform X2 [Brienomyrus brachyistius]|uniref:E3 ubiquitin-protein ligase DCST1 isoform X2 n=1 Tax=Brienomyrus brachyistius TaxID=42636 RepID=UPI0020B42D83|nr:E3 ubiquitin-protein ligase DCST1 isoform X2 [Brienomyrus brachyistius]
MTEADGLNRRKTPHTKLEMLSEQSLPASVHRFLFGHPDRFPVVRLFAGVAFGVFCGLGLFIGLTNNIPMSAVSRWISGYVFVGLCVIGAVTSSYFRCSVLLMFPCMLSSQGRTYIMLLVLYAVYQGPVANIHRNVQDVAFSMGCNIDLQVEHSKVMWEALLDPLMNVVQSIVDHKDVLQGEAENVSRMFQNITDEIMGEYGYDTKDQKLAGTGNSTQEQFFAKTLMRCDYVVQNGITQCRNWFNSTWQKCMRDVQVPLINLILCVPLQLHFLCDVMKVMIPWCKQEIPVDVNFGDVYDKLNDCINRLRGDFGASVVYKRTEQESILSQEEFVEKLSREFDKKMVVLEQILDIFHGLLSCTFIFIFISAFRYGRQYNRDICFDNMYITTYFRQIDARRRKAGKRHLLPLKKAEQPYFINPWSLYIYPCELRCLVLGLLQVISLGICVGLLLVTDWVLYRIFDIVRKYTLTEFSIHSSHHMEFSVGGQSMLAKLLQKTVHAFNTSSNLEVKSSNKHCLPNPNALSWEEYLWIFSPLLVMATMCCLQVYSNRLRRIIAAFYFPKMNGQKSPWTPLQKLLDSLPRRMAAVTAARRGTNSTLTPVDLEWDVLEVAREKKRTLFLYNLQIQRRISYVETQRIRLMRRGKPRRTVFSALLFMLEKLPLKLRRCCVCGDRQGGSRAVRCPGAVCEAVYCPQCWRDLGRRCFACTPYTHFGPDVPYDTHTYAE